MTLLTFLNFFFTQLKLILLPSIYILSKSKQNIIIFKLQNGFVIFNIDFFFKLKESKTQLKLIDIFKNSIYSVMHSYKRMILSKGVGYKFEIKKTKTKKLFYCKLKAGYNEPIIFKYPNSIFKLKSPKPTRLSIQSNYFTQVVCFLRYIKQYRIRNVYTGKGFSIRYQYKIKKEVRKSK